MTIAKFKFKKRYLLLLIFIIFLLPPLLIALSRYWQATDNDPERGALVLKTELFGENVNKIVYLEQNWKPSQSLWFYNTTQGSNLLPYDFFLVLEQAGKRELCQLPCAN